jgi:hypothetical protein
LLFPCPSSSSSHTLFTASQLLFELNNVIDDTYTGVFSTVLTATFYEPTEDFPRPPGADFILPITTNSTNSSQMLVYPGDASASVSIPKNTAEAWLEVLATGAAEEVRFFNLVNLFFDADPCVAGVLVRERA